MPKYLTTKDMIFHNPSYQRWPELPSGFFTIPAGSQVYRCKRTRQEVLKFKKRGVDFWAVSWFGQRIYLESKYIKRV